MLAFANVIARPDFTVTTVTCHDDHKGWSEVESPSDYRVVLVRQGRFRRKSGAVPAELDGTLAYVGVPGEEEHFAHPAGGDVSTLVSLTPRLWRDLAGDQARLMRSTVYVDARLDLTHRRILAAGSDADAVTDELMALLVHVLDQVVIGSRPAGASASDRTLADSARAAIGSDHPAAHTLFALSELLEVSPYRLSRAFTRQMGVTLTRYRNRVRLGRALDRLENGERSLAALAADLGFADQAHLCRTMNDHLGQTPAAVRRLLSVDRASS